MITLSPLEQSKLKVVGGAKKEMLDVNFMQKQTLVQSTLYIPAFFYGQGNFDDKNANIRLMWFDGFAESRDDKSVTWRCKSVKLFQQLNTEAVWTNIVLKYILVCVIKLKNKLKFGPSGLSDYSTT